jgi:SNF2 family DNA or RNA helicase
LEELRAMLLAAKNTDHRVEEDLMRSRKFYEAITHSLKSNVSEQPKLLKGGQLKDFQITGLSWLVSLYQNGLNGILADEMGLGKKVPLMSSFLML